MKILIKFTSRSRPQKFFNCIKNIEENLFSDNYHILGTFDLDDGTMNNELVISKLKEIKNFTYIFGHSKNKIDAINRDMDLISDWDILINMSDDMRFVCENFDEAIRNEFKSSTDLFVHFSDGNQRDRVCTMSIMGREYYNRFKYIYHPDYKSLWCDCEATEVARMLGKYRYMGNHVILFNHIHPAWGMCSYDEQYMKTESPEMWAHDEEVYNRRKQNNFDINVHA